MNIDLIVRFLVYFIEYTAVIILALSSFRLPIRYNFHKIVIVSFLATFVASYVNQLPYAELSPLILLITEIIMVFLLFRLPIIFSFLICLLGNLVVGTFEYLVSSITELFVPNFEELVKSSLIVIVIFDLAITFLILALVYFLQKRKIGYHFTERDSLRGYNFVLSALLVCAVLFFLIAPFSVKANSYSFYIPTIAGLISFLIIYFAYKHNKKLWKERRERLEKR